MGRAKTKLAKLAFLYSTEFRVPVFRILSKCLFSWPIATTVQKVALLGNGFQALEWRHHARLCLDVMTLNLCTEMSIMSSRFLPNFSNNQYTDHRTQIRGRLVHLAAYWCITPPYFIDSEMTDHSNNSIYLWPESSVREMLFVVYDLRCHTGHLLF